MKRTALLIVTLATVTACADEPVMTEAATTAEVRGATAAEHQGLAAARRATARFHRFEEAQAADYTFLFMDMCMDNPGVGGMGYHYVNVEALLDPTLDVTRPEAVMYEPGPNGQMRLVGLEYVIPADLWTSPTPPTLLGQELELNDFDLWALHVWIWKNNPAGIFEPWNPDVSC
jgi:hypothetical protein